MLGDLFGVGLERYADGTLRWNNCLNWMKAGILYANRVQPFHLAMLMKL